MIKEKKWRSKKGKENTKNGNVREGLEEEIAHEKEKSRRLIERIR